MSEVDARKERIDEENAWQLLRGAVRVHIGSRAKHESWVPGDGSRGEIISKAVGRSGNLRAPTLKVGDEFLVGFNASMYESILK